MGCDEAKSCAISAGVRTTCGTGVGDSSTWIEASKVLVTNVASAIDSSVLAKYWISAILRTLTWSLPERGCGHRTDVRCSPRDRVHRHVRRHYFARRAASKATPTMTNTTPNI